MSETNKQSNNAIQPQSVWHDIEDVPERFREIAFLDKKGRLFAPYYAPSNERWRFICIITEAVKWAYSDDLKPTN